MNSDDTLYGRIKNGVLTLSGNNASLRVDGGYLVVSDGPWAVAPDRVGPAQPIADRMVTHRFRRADCPINRIVVTRPDGFITFAAIKWLYGVGASRVQLDWDGTVLLASAQAVRTSRLYVALRRWPPRAGSVSRSRGKFFARSSAGRPPLQGSWGAARPRRSL